MNKTTQKKLKELIRLEANSQKLKARKEFKDIEQRKRKTRTKARRLLDGATAAGTLKVWFASKDISGNQGIVDRD